MIPFAESWPRPTSDLFLHRILILCLVLVAFKLSLTILLTPKNALLLQFISSRPVLKTLLKTVRTHVSLQLALMALERRRSRRVWENVTLDKVFAFRTLFEALPQAIRDFAPLKLMLRRLQRTDKSCQQSAGGPKLRYLLRRRVGIKQYVPVLQVLRLRPLLQVLLQRVAAFGVCTGWRDGGRVDGVGGVRGHGDDGCLIAFEFHKSIFPVICAKPKMRLRYCFDVERAYYAV